MAERPGSIPESDLVALLIDVRDDVRTGFTTLHSKFDGLNNKIDTHARDDVSMEHKLRVEIAGVRDEHTKTAQAVAKIVGERTAEDRFGAPPGTGRFQVAPPPPPSSPHETGTPAIPGATVINIGSDHHGRKSRASSAPIVEAVGKFLGSGAGKLGAAAGLLLAGYLTHYVSATPETRVITVQSPPLPPAEVAPVAVATVSPVLPALSASASAPSAPDAGTKRPR